MKILQITPFFTPTRGGVAVVPHLLSRELSKRRHEVTIITTDFEFDENYVKTLEEEIKVIPFNCIANVKLFLISPSMKKWLKKEIGKFDIIHMHAFRSYQNIIAHRYSRKLGVPYIVQAHGTLTRKEKTSIKLLYDILIGHKILRDTSKAIALTKTEAEQYKKMGVDEKKIEIIPNGINPSEYRLPPKGGFKTKYGIDDDEKVVLYLGRMHKSKGIDLLIKSFAILVKMLNNVRLVLVGPDDGFLNEALLLAKRLKLESKVLFTGFVSKENKLKAFMDADVFVTPIFCGFPITFMEACIAGVPIVTTTLGDILSWINGRVGFISSATSEDLSKAIYKILSSNEIYDKFSRNCKDIVRKEFSIENVVSKLEGLYRKIIH